MLKEVLIDIYKRDLDKLKSEIEQYANEADIWKTDPGIANSGGNLCLHLSGNLQHFVGAVLGRSGYVRDRDAEFSSADITRSRLLTDIDSTIAVVIETLEKLTDEALAKNYPIEVFGQPMTTGFFLTHLATHFNYHLGQINYHRRLLSEPRT
ncbi:MAG TPA: DinB family protein [Pyrinomonadaceae bacterium]|jgi:uncharacterized damage-inducible protein DinB|nr:DinB family protein [Pyrinomonadaceae bacterium]